MQPMRTLSCTNRCLMNGNKISLTSIWSLSMALSLFTTSSKNCSWSWPSDSRTKSSQSLESLKASLRSLLPLYSWEDSVLTSSLTLLSKRTKSRQSSFQLENGLKVKRTRIFKSSWLKRPKNKRSRRKSRWRRQPNRLSLKLKPRRRDLSKKLKMKLSRSSMKSRRMQASSPRTTMKVLKMRTTKNPKKMMTMKNPTSTDSNSGNILIHI